MRTTWSLFWCISAQSQAKLMQYHWDNYGFRLEIPSLPGDFHYDTELEPLEELERLMRQKPHHPKRVA